MLKNSWKTKPPKGRIGAATIDFTLDDDDFLAGDSDELELDESEIYDADDEINADDLHLEDAFDERAAADETVAYDDDLDAELELDDGSDDAVAGLYDNMPSEALVLDDVMDFGEESEDDAIFDDDEPEAYAEDDADGLELYDEADGEAYDEEYAEEEYYDEAEADADAEAMADEYDDEAYAADDNDEEYAAYEDDDEYLIDDDDLMELEAGGPKAKNPGRAAGKAAKIEDLSDDDLDDIDFDFDDEFDFDLDDNDELAEGEDAAVAFDDEDDVSLAEADDDYDAALAAKAESAAKAKAEEQARIKAQAVAKAKAEEQAKVKALAAAKAKAEAEARQKAQDAAKAKAEAQAKLKAQALAKAKAEARAKAAEDMVEPETAEISTKARIRHEESGIFIDLESADADAEVMDMEAEDAGIEDEFVDDTAKPVLQKNTTKAVAAEAEKPKPKTGTDKLAEIQRQAEINQRRIAEVISQTVKVAPAATPPPPPPANIQNRRQHNRIQASILVDYISTDDAGDSSQGMGVVLDISLSGLQLQTPRELAGKHIKVFATDFNDSVMEIKGLVRQARPKDGVYLNGISFESPENDTIKFITNLVRIFNARKYMKTAE